MMLFPTLPVGFVGERKALALLLLAFYVALYGLLSILLANAPPDQPELRAWWGCFAALSLCYGLSFFSVAAGWFWARWFAVGLGYSGLTMAGWGILMQRSIEPVLVFYGLTHGLVALLLQGEKMAAEFDARKDWREHWKLDDEAAQKVRHTVTRAATGLPTLIMFALAPRESVFSSLALLMACFGLYGVLRMRTWGVMLLFGASMAALGMLSSVHVHAPAAYHLLPSQLVHGLGLLGALFLFLASVPVGRPMLRYLINR